MASCCLSSLSDDSVGVYFGRPASGKSARFFGALDGEFLQVRWVRLYSALGCLVSSSVA